MLTRIQTTFNFTDYQMEQLKYFAKSSAAECSKILILALLFQKKLPLFAFAAVLLCCLRIFSGGLHCKTYIRCFFTSLLFFWIVLQVLSPITLKNTLQLCLLLLCIIIGYIVSPVTSKCHLELTPETIHRCRTRFITILFFYLLAMYIIPANQFLQTGFWVIILHTLQLMLTKILQKGVSQYERKAI